MDLKNNKKPDLLEQRNIKIYESEFLKDKYQNRKIAKKIEFNPRDKHGKRLSVYWQPGETIWSVIYKKISYRLSVFLNPDTYTQQKFNEIRKYLVLNKLTIYIYLFMTVVPLSFFIPFLMPRFKKVKREFILQQYFKRRFLQEEFKLGNKKISRAQMQKILKQANQKINI